jgi:hypothetical protein
LLAAFGVVAIALAQLSALEQAPAPTDTAVGIVVQVDGPDVARVTSFVLRVDAETVLTFDVETLRLDQRGKPAPHLREHMVSGQPIEVEYYRDEGRDRLVAVRYRDAD